jgi:hypothetical protein
VKGSSESDFPLLCSASPAHDHFNILRIRAAIKSTVSHLAVSSLRSDANPTDKQNRFSLGPRHPACKLLIEAILEWSKALACHSSGNYLLQQLLDKANLADKQKFIKLIK